MECATLVGCGWMLLDMCPRTTLVGTGGHAAAGIRMLKLCAKQTSLRLAQGVSASVCNPILVASCLTASRPKRLLASCWAMTGTKRQAVT